MGKKPYLMTEVSLSIKWCLKNRRTQWRCNIDEKSSVTLLMCELDSCVGVSLPRLMTVGVCRRNGWRQVNRYVYFICFLSWRHVRNINALLEGLWLLFTWELRFSLKEVGASRISVCLVIRRRHTRIEITESILHWQWCAFGGCSFYTLPEICVVRTQPGRPRSLRLCGWPLLPLHGWHPLGPHHPPEPRKHILQHTVKDIFHCTANEKILKFF